MRSGKHVLKAFFRITLARYAPWSIPSWLPAALAFESNTFIPPHVYPSPYPNISFSSAIFISASMGVIRLGSMDCTASLRASALGSACWKSDI